MKRRDADREIEVSLRGRSRTRGVTSVVVGGQKATRLVPGDCILKSGSLEVLQGEGPEGNALQFRSGRVERPKRQGGAALNARAGAVKGRGLGGGGDLSGRKVGQFVGEGLDNTKKRIRKGENRGEGDGDSLINLIYLRHIRRGFQAV
ncbi:hypothetical protein NDU88_010712 [Pleurodeles waltl]|uniref:Uncharacterized protein n=1 Tax=Pleurodeles waltl TaxID=8319 RepID=A0AAV7QWG9_PLEWA|nr:hypothetical protein NDU88_010712 [Pleurodeles waltl]